MTVSIRWLLFLQIASNHLILIINSDDGNRSSNHQHHRLPRNNNYNELMMMCYAVSSIQYGVSWPNTTACTASIPPCIDDNHEFQLRCCVDGVWAAEPICYHIQQDPSPCPSPTFTYNLQYDVCYARTVPSIYNESICPYADILPFGTYEPLINALQLGPVWMPVQRDNSNGLGFFRWIEASELYRTKYNDHYYAMGDTVMGRNCLVYHNSSYIVAVTCNEEEYAHLCVYSPLASRENTYCAQKLQNLCMQSDFSTKSKCFCSGSSSSSLIEDDHHSRLYNQIEFLQPYQNLLYSSTAGSMDDMEQCLIALEKRSQDGKYFWTRSGIEINYTYWSSDMVFNDDGSRKFGAITSNGWVLLESETDSTCYLYEVDISEKIPELQLTYESANDIFTVYVTNPNDLKWLKFKTELLIYCFTDASSYDLLYRYEDLTQTESLDTTLSFHFAPHPHGPGHYWCEAFQYPSLDPINSNVILLRRPLSGFYEEFIAVFTVSYVKGTNPLSSGIIEFFERILYIRLLQVDYLQQFYTTRLTKILHVNEIDHEITVNFHFTGTKQSTSSSNNNNVEELDYVRNLIDTALSEIDGIRVTMEQFLSVDFCREERNINDNLTWPTTSVDTIAYPVEFCFRIDNGLRLSRRCSGNFLDGAEWDPVEASCEIATDSPVTDDLLDLLNSATTNTSNMQAIIDNVTSITEQYFGDFQPIDVFLIGEILEKAALANDINLQSLSQLISNLLDVNRDVLLLSQTQMNSTDKILENIDEIADASSLMESDHFEIVTKNFALIVSNLSETNMSGLIIDNNTNNNNNTYELTTLYGDVSNFSEILNNHQNLDVAILFNQTLLDQIRSTNTSSSSSRKLVLTIHVTNALFNEESNNNNVSVKIFGVTFPGFSEQFTAPISIFYQINNTQTKTMKGDCVHWSYGNNTRGYWETDDQNSDSLIMNLQLMSCQFWHVTHFGLLLMDDDDNMDGIDALHLLDLITNINCGLSMCGLFAILFTALIYKNWRKNIGNQILMHFAFALIIQIAMLYLSNMVYYSSNTDINESSSVLCTIIGCLLHYSIVSEFCWMLIIAILQFKRFVEVLGGPPKYILLKACLCGWALPLLPVICVLLLDDSTYLMSHVGLCYPTGLSLYLGIWLPIGLIVAINTVIFIYIIYNVVHRKTECNGVITGNSELLFEWRLAILLFFMLGLTWSFGLFIQLDFGIVFLYLFCFTSTLQGFIMFLFFIVFNKNTRFLYLRSIRKCCFSRTYY